MMIKKAWVLAAGVAMMAIAGSAGAADFAFSFSGTGTGLSLVTGDIYGLADSGSSQPTSLSVQYGGQTYDFVPTPGEYQGIDGSFTVSDDAITSSAYENRLETTSDELAYELSLGGGAVDFDTFTGQYAQYTTADTPVIFTPLALTISAAPEPSTWLLMMAGIGGIGLMMRWNKRERGSVAGAAVV
jgi:hypothetical protein